MGDEATLDLDDFLTLIEENVTRIKVRTQVDGKWCDAVLEELPATLAIKYVCRFIREKRIPFVLGAP